MSSGSWQSRPDGAGVIVAVADGVAPADPLGAAEPVPAGAEGLAPPAVGLGAPDPPGPGEPPWPGALGRVRGASFAQSATMTAAPPGSALPPMPLMSTKKCGHGRLGDVQVTRSRRTSYPQASPFGPWSSPSATPSRTENMPAEPATAEPEARAMTWPVSGSTPTRVVS